MLGSLGKMRLSIQRQRCGIMKVVTQLTATISISGESSGAVRTQISHSDSLTEEDIMRMLRCAMDTLGQNISFSKFSDLAKDEEIESLEVSLTATKYLGLLPPSLA